MANPQPKLLSGTPKINKNSKVKTRSASYKKGVSAANTTNLGSVARNNNAQLDLAVPECSQRPSTRDGNQSNLNVQNVSDDQMKYGVRDSEDEFPEENSDQEREIDSESDADRSTEDDESTASGSVIIAPVDQEVLQRQHQEELKLLSENPYFKTLVKDIVDAICGCSIVSGQGN